jgi:hypothetical protein
MNVYAVKYLSIIVSSHNIIIIVDVIVLCIRFYISQSMRAHSDYTPSPYSNHSLARPLVLGL